MATAAFLKSQKGRDVALAALIEKRIQKSMETISFKDLESFELKK